MGTMLLILTGGLFFGLIVFFICEEKSLKDADFSDMKGLFTQELKAVDSLKKFQTIKYLVVYFIALVIFDLVIINLVLDPNALEWSVVLAYTFMPSLVGSWFILLVKWTYQPVIKLASSFMYGAGYIAAAAISFGVTHFILI